VPRNVATQGKEKRMERLKLGIAEIVAATGESTHVVYDAINAGHLQTFLVGRRRFARPEAVRNWIDFLEAQSNAGKPIVYRARSAERTGAPK
jgi:hypothetical protein